MFTELANPMSVCTVCTELGQQKMFGLCRWFFAVRDFD